MRILLSLVIAATALAVQPWGATGITQADLGVAVKNTMDQPDKYLRDFEAGIKISGLNLEADIGFQMNALETALLASHMPGSGEVVRILLQYGANPYARAGLGEKNQRMREVLGAQIKLHTRQLESQQSPDQRKQIERLYLMRHELELALDRAEEAKRIADEKKGPLKRWGDNTKARIRRALDNFVNGTPTEPPSTTVPGHFQP